MLLTLREINQIEKIRVNIQLDPLDIPDDPRVQDLVAKNKEALVHLVMSTVGLDLSGVQDKYIRAYVNDHSFQMSISFHFETKAAIYRDHTGKPIAVPAEQGRHSRPRLEHIELKPLCFDTKLNQWNFGIPVEVKK